MKRFVNWMKVVLPPKWVMVLWVGSYLLLMVLPHAMAWSYGLPELDMTAQFQKTINGVLGFLIFLYAILRALIFHPYFNPAYLEWLMRTPWTYGKPLPNGPLHLVPQDAIFVGVLTLLNYYASPEHWFLTPAVFLTPHALACGFTFIYSRQFRQVYLMALLLSGFLYVYQSPLLVGGFIARLSLIAASGIRDTLRGFHEWTSEACLSNPFLQLNSEKAKELKRTQLLGWPYDRTGPIQSNPKLSNGWSIAISLLLGWWVFSLSFLFLPEIKASLVILMIILWCCSWIPTIICMPGYSSPISWWGRLRTGRWIIPGYDKIFLSPLIIGCVLLLSIIFVVLLPDFNPVTMGLTTAACVFLSFFLTPDLSKWRLTGNHRIVTGIGLSQSEFIQTQ